MSVPDPRVRGPVCRSCRRDVDWSNVVRVDREMERRVWERAYVCPHCRALLEFACWQTAPTN